MSQTLRVVVGRIGRAHGIRGELSIDPRTDEPQRRFAAGSSVVCAGRTYTIASSRPHQTKWLLKFDEVPDRTAAEALQGKMLEADVDPTEIPDDGYYDHQLIGLRVVTDDGVESGEVTGVLHLPAHDLLTISTSGGEVMVPFVEELIPEVDLAASTLTVRDRPGLLRPDEAEEAR